MKLLVRSMCHSEPNPISQSLFSEKWIVGHSQSGISGLKNEILRYAQDDKIRRKENCYD
jgi:hypothetical protein